MTRRLLAFLAAVALGAVAVAGCSHKKAPERAEPAAYASDSAPSQRALSPAPLASPDAPMRVGGFEGAPAGVVGGAAKAATPAENPTVPPGGQVAVPRDRKLIRDATASLEVKSLDAAIDRLRSLTEAAGGYVTNELRGRDEHGVGRGNVTLRVPAAKLDSLTAALKSIGTVQRFQITANDITEEYFNLELRLRNQRALEARLLELLARPGNKLSDLLETERELARVRGEIDQLEGRQRFWDSRVSLSTVNVELHEPEPAVVGEQGGAWAALKRSFSEAADNFVLAIAGIIAVTGGLIPVIVALAIAVALIARFWRWRRRRRAAKSVAPQA